MAMYSIWTTFLLWFVLSISVKTEIYTAQSELEQLLVTESILLQTLNQYIADQESRITTLKNHAERYEAEHLFAVRNIQNYLSNPLNDYSLVKRLLVDWKITDSFMRDPYYEIAVKRLTQNYVSFKYPTDDDLIGTITAIFRIQDTYKLDTTSMASGELNGIKYSTKFTANDCFVLGLQSYNSNDFYHAELWLNEALTRHEQEKSSMTVRWAILEYLVNSTFMQGNVEKAVDLTTELLSIHPNREHIESNLAYFKNVTKTRSNKVKENIKLKNSSSPMTDSELRDHFHMACREENLMPVHISSQLRCRYTDNNKNPLLLIAPLKEEDVFLNPRVILYREVLYDGEIETIKDTAKPLLKRASVQNSTTGEMKYVDYRISKSAWLNDNDDILIAKVTKRIEAMTSLSAETAEPLQIVNYGAGGHYDPHYDFARTKQADVFKEMGTGNRIATVLFYMSDVAEGGATVFPELGLSIQPVKGTAAVWYNLHSNGNGDLRTWHAACPVLQGTKWVCNKWFHEVGQEFKRPCTVKENI